MLLTEKLANLGDLFFRYRSYVFPVGVSLLLILERKHFYYFGDSHKYDLVFEMICFSVAFLGFAMRLLTVGYCRQGTSGRNMSKQKAESLNTDGLYSVVRNPLYIGNLLGIIGVSMLSQSYEVVLINVLLFSCFYVPVMLREERFLADNFGCSFLDYAGATPAVLPDVRLWKKPQLRFNLLRGLYREHDTFMGIVAAFFAAELLREYSINKKLRLDETWTGIFIIALIIWAMLRAFKRKLKSMDKAV